MSGIKEALDALAEAHEERLAETEMLAEGRLRNMTRSRDAWRRRCETLLELLIKSQTAVEDARREILARDVEVATAPSQIPNLADFEEGDLVDVNFSDRQSTHRVRNVVYGYDFSTGRYVHVTINLDLVEPEAARTIESATDFRWSERP